MQPLTSVAQSLAKRAHLKRGGSLYRRFLAVMIEIALKTNPLLRATTSGRAMADAQVEEARASRLPLLQFSETFARSNNPVFVFGSLLEQGHFGPQNFDPRFLNNPDALNNSRVADFSTAAI